MIYGSGLIKNTIMRLSQSYSYSDDYLSIIWALTLVRMLTFLTKTKKVVGYNLLKHVI